jgi:hypothetical protein
MPCLTREVWPLCWFTREGRESWWFLVAERHPAGWYFYARSTSLPGVRSVEPSPRLIAWAEARRVTPVPALSAIGTVRGKFVGDRPRRLAAASGRRFLRSNRDCDLGGRRPRAFLRTQNASRRTPARHVHPWPRSTLVNRDRRAPCEEAETPTPDSSEPQGPGTDEGDAEAEGARGAA